MTKRPESALAIIDRLMLRSIAVTVNGQRQKVAALDAILLHLFQKNLAGDGHASRVFLRYLALAPKSTKSRLRVVFADDEYTRMLAGETKESDDV